MMVDFSFSNWIDPKSLGSPGMENFNGLPTPTKVEAPLGTDSNGGCWQPIKILHPWASKTFWINPV